MTFTFPDNLLKAAHLDERSLAIEIACHLYHVQRLTLSQARRLSGLSRGEFEDELQLRHIPIYPYTVEMFQDDLQTIDSLEDGR